PSQPRREHPSHSLHLSTKRYPQATMNPEIAIRAVIDLVPNWYEAEGGPFGYSLEAAGVNMPFYSQRALTPELQALLVAANKDLPDLIQRVGEFPESVGIDLIQEYFAEYWLRLLEPEIEWTRLLNYSR